MNQITFIKTNAEDASPSLSHYGVKGMKWGIRKRRPVIGFRRRRMGSGFKKALKVGAGVAGAAGAAYLGAKYGRRFLRGRRVARIGSNALSTKLRRRPSLRGAASKLRNAGGMAFKSAKKGLHRADQVAYSYGKRGVNAARRGAGSASKAIRKAASGAKSRASGMFSRQGVDARRNRGVFPNATVGKTLQEMRSAAGRAAGRAKSYGGAAAGKAKSYAKSAGSAARTAAGRAKSYASSAGSTAKSTARKAASKGSKAYSNLRKRIRR